MEEKYIFSMTKTNYVIAGVIVVAIGLLIFGTRANRPTLPAGPIDPEALSKIQTGEAPWQAETSQLFDRLRAIGLPALPEEGNVLHIHQHLDIFVHGSPVVVPTNIGVNVPGNFIAPIHSHDTTGIMHVESPTVQDFTLGQFFDVWGVRLTENCIGGYCNEGEHVMRVYSNGELVTGDPRSLVLTRHQEIVVTYGTEAQVPSPVPATFSFPTGL